MRNRSFLDRRRNGSVGLEKVFILLSILFTAGLVISNYYLVSQSTERNDSIDQKQHETNYAKDELSRQKSTFLRTDNSQKELHNRDTIQNNDSSYYPSSFTSSSDVVIDPATIPSFFTPITENHLHNGRVVQELSRRLLSRNIAQSNVIVMSPDFGDTSRSNDDNLLYPAKLAMEQGHTTHLLPATTNLSSRNYYNSTSVSWVLLAYFSTAGLHNNEQYNIDDILSPSNAGAWLSQTTITYLVFPIRAKAILPYSSILRDASSIHTFEYHRDYLRGAKLAFTGLTAAQTLLNQDFKLQLLASSHHFDATPIRVNNDGWDIDGESAFDYKPNSLFMSAKALHRFLHQRIVEVLEQEVKNILEYYPRKTHQSNESHGEMNHVMHRHNQTLEVEFHSLLFATQGLDLAIPARSSYTDVGQHKACIEVSGSHRRMTRCDPKLGARALNDTIFMSCPSRHSALKVRFGLDIGEIDYRTQLEKRHGVSIDLYNSFLKAPDEKSDEMEVWTSAKSPKASEAICVKTNKDAILPSVACTTKIIPNDKMDTKAALKNGKDKRTNLLFVMIDPLSRLQLRRSLPNTWALLEALGFVDFVHYTAVGNNSGPNQAALYSGMKLEGGRQGIKGSDAPKEGGDKRRLWLWDRLKKAGYITMKIEDGCVSNSNMVQSIGPETDHGQQLYEMFCYSFDRPNCLGSSLMAEHAVNYTRQFIDTYESHSKPWAAFVSFIDSHEDSSTLISYLDGILLDFLQSIPLQNTMIVFTSDHGLHYGPTFASKSGEIERALPQLSIRLPESIQKPMRRTLHSNAQMFTTAFDTHKTILNILLKEGHDELLGLSLLKPLPKSRRLCQTTADIPSQFCPSPPSKEKQCRFMVDPPSILSFYSDIPRSNRPRWPDQCPIRRKHDVIGNEFGPCQCATNERDWFDCSNMTREGFRSNINLLSEHFSIRSCGHHESDKSLDFDIHIKKNQELLDERAALAKEVAMSNLAKSHRDDEIQASYDGQPNIIFLEIDSVSLSFSERFFPQTWGLLQSHKIQSAAEGLSCPSGWCAGMFNKTSVVGQNSIINQLAALSGCLEVDDAREKLNHYKHSSNDKTSHCPASGSNSLGVKGSEMNSDHWIFDVAKKLGYLTFFGEEFCYEDSPYVVQSQSAFTLEVDFALDPLFCRLAKDWLKINGKVISQKRTYNVEYDEDEVPNSCFDGKSRGEIGLEYISQIWNAYNSVPKFAYLNALAAHDYSIDAAHMPLSSENYDSAVFRFLSNIMARNEDTFIVLRSDHGLQGGPHPIDYAIQIEHMHPFTAIIAPAKHQSLSIEKFASNQNRLATGFDIYHTMRFLMSASSNDDKGKSKLLFDYGIPRWSYNLLRQSIPINRNCEMAKIPKRFCPCIDERSDMAPGFYVGHSEQFDVKKYNLPLLDYDWNRRKFVAPTLPGQLLLKKQSKYDVALNRNVSPPVCNTTFLDHYIDTGMIEESWQLINNITSLHPGSDVSGGIYLYPRQAMLLVYLVQREVASRARMRNSQKTLQPFRVCETGFGSGHSAALFLSSAPNIQVVSFDKFDRQYQNAAFSALRSLYGNRLTRVVGDSCNTVKQYKKKCDFLHGSSLCKTDNIDLIAKSIAGVTLTSTAMSSLTDKSVYFGKGAQWATLKKGGCIDDIACFTEEETKISADLYLAKGREQSISHQFCFARNTGNCTGGNVASMGQVVSSSRKWHKDDLCQNWMIETPNIGAH